MQPLAEKALVLPSKCLAARRPSAKMLLEVRPRGAQHPAALLLVAASGSPDFPFGIRSAVLFANPAAQEKTARGRHRRIAMTMRVLRLL